MTQALGLYTGSPHEQKKNNCFELKKKKESAFEQYWQVLFGTFERRKNLQKEKKGGNYNYLVTSFQVVPERVVTLNGTFQSTTASST